MMDVSKKPAFMAGLGAAISILLAVASCGGNPDGVDPIVIAVSGSHFRPAMELSAAAAVSVDYGDGSPAFSINAGAGPLLLSDYAFADGPGPHEAILRVTPWTALAVLNLGFRGGDGGNGSWERELSDLPEFRFHPSFETVDWSEDEEATVIDYVGSVTAVSGLSAAPNLVAFCCEFQPITVLDLSGCANLLSLEGYLSDIQSTNFQGCVSLRRSCLESTGARANWRVENGVRTDDEVLDLRDCPDLRDIRGSGDDHTMLYLNPGALDTLWHLCKMGNGRMQSLKIGDEAPGKLDVQRFTALLQCWIQGSPVIESLIIDNGVTDDVDAARCGITLVDVSGQTQLRILLLSGNGIESINLNGCSGLQTLDLGDCGLDRDQVDSVLAVMDGFGSEPDDPAYCGIFLAYEGGDAPNAAPSAAGFAHAAALRGRGWTVTVEE
jgi:hypothetical protein